MLADAVVGNHTYSRAYLAGMRTRKAIRKVAARVALTVRLHVWMWTR